MKISELIINLEKIKEINGDIAVEVKDSENSYNEIYSLGVRLDNYSPSKENWKVYLES